MSWWDKLNFLKDWPQNQLNLKMLASMLEGKLGHAFLFWGPDHDYLYQLALSFAAAINCPHKGCSTCQVCKNTIKGIHPNLLTVEADGNILTVDKIKQIQNFCSLTSYNSQKKIVIVKEAERLNQEASNKFLKTLEDPPGPQCVFILLCQQPGMLLPTIYSRCLAFEWSFDMNAENGQQFDELELMVETGMKRIIGQDIGETLKLGQKICGWLDGQGRSLAQEQKQLSPEEGGPDKAMIKKKVSRLNRLGMEKVFDIIVAWLEDMVAVVLGAGSKVLHYSQNHDFLDSSLIGIKADRLLNLLELVEENRYYLSRSINQELALDTIFLGLNEAIRGEAK